MYGMLTVYIECNALAAGQETSFVWEEFWTARLLLHSLLELLFAHADGAGAVRLLPPL